MLGKPGYWILILLLKLLEEIISFVKLNFKKRKHYFKDFINSCRKIIRVLKLAWQLTEELGQTFIERIRKRIKRQLDRPLKERRYHRKINNRIAAVLVVFGFILMIAGAIINLFKDLPSPDRLLQRGPQLTTKIYDRSKVLLYKIYRDQNRSLVPLEKIPASLVQATLAIEDKDFYRHGGLSLKGIIRAFRHNTLYPEEPQFGGSTITQQLVKNTLLTNEKTFRRKIREAILAIMVDTKFSKDEILQMYLNEIPYGGSVYGVEEASQKYFGKHVWEINAAEAAFLAGLAKAPSKYSPFSDYPEFTKRRQEQVVGEMVEAKYLTPEEAIEIIATPLRFIKQKDLIKAPHFVFYIKELLNEAYGEKVVEQGGLEVTTTLDWKTQQMAEKIVQEEVDQLANFKISNGAALVINPKSGEILAMVGSKDYFDFENDGNVNVTLRPRQPGSAIKPINYSVALEKGYTAATVIPDTAITYRIPGQPPYSPQNYDGKFHGNVPLRVALASSLNVPAVKVLSSYGVDQMVAMGQKMGITTWDDPSRFGLSLTLGGGEVKMIDLAQAYASLANLGKITPFNPFIQIKDYHEKVIYQNRCLNESYCPGEYQVVKPEIAFILNDILSDNSARTLAFGPNSLLKVPNQKVAAKTGTSNNLRDNWCFGYTPSVLVAVWVGNNDNTPMSRVASGVTGATPIWYRIINQMLERKPQEEWLRPEGVLRVAICQTTGTLACQNCPKITEEYFINGTQPSQACQIEEDFEPNRTINFQPTTSISH